MQGDDLTPENPVAPDTPHPVQAETADQAAGAAPGSGGTAPTSLDLDAIQQDLADVEVALARLDAGSYWTDEVTGEALPAELLAERPTARRA
ncbi:MAG: hypothetical protein ACOYMR_01095 [Ilumatobacteraceae bacterium]